MSGWEHELRRREIMDSEGPEAAQHEKPDRIKPRFLDCGIAIGPQNDLFNLIREAQECWLSVSRGLRHPVNGRLAWLVGYLSTIISPRNPVDWDKVLEALQMVEKDMEPEAYPAGMLEALHKARDIAQERAMEAIREEA